MSPPKILHKDQLPSLNQISDNVSSTVKPKSRSPTAVKGCSFQTHSVLQINIPWRHLELQRWTVV